MGEGGLVPPEESQNIGFSSDTGMDPQKNHKATKQHSMLGHHRHASETPFNLRFAGGSMMAPLILSLTKNM